MNSDHDDGIAAFSSIQKTNNQAGQNLGARKRVKDTLSKSGAGICVVGVSARALGCASPLGLSAPLGVGDATSSASASSAQRPRASKGERVFLRIAATNQNASTVPATINNVR